MVLPKRNVPALEDEELTGTVRSFQEFRITAAIARVLEPFASGMYQPPKNLPNGLETLFDNGLRGCTYKEIVAQPIDLSMSLDDIQAIELATRD